MGNICKILKKVIFVRFGNCYHMATLGIDASLSFFIMSDSVFLLVPTIMVIIFWNFTMFYYRPDEPQVKRNVISSKVNLVYALPHELPNDLRLKILGNKEILGKS